MWKKVNGANGEYKVFLITDIHIKAGMDGNPSDTGATNGTRYYYASPNNLRNFVTIANREKPDLVVCTGDLSDNPSNWELVNEIWSGLNDNIPRVITPGNHDFDVQTFPDLLNLLRYKGKKEIGGSKFNQSFTLSHRGFNSKFIMLDTTFNSGDTHGNHYENVRAHTSSVNWLQSELVNSDSNQVFICTHVGPHLVDIDYFDSDQKEQIQTIVDNAVSSNPKLKVTWMFGHHHVADIGKYMNLGSNNVGYLIPAVVLNEEGRFAELKISNDGFSLTKRNLPYALS